MNDLVDNNPCDYVDVDSEYLGVDLYHTARIGYVEVGAHNTLTIAYHLCDDMIRVRDVFFLNGMYSSSAVNKLNCYLANSNLPSISRIHINIDTVLEELPGLCEYLAKCIVGKKVLICRKPYRDLGFYNEVRFI